MRKYSLSALVAAGMLVGGLSAGSASAADLGGNCCADLEERIAELEATTARKGNRKVSLTISGWVGEQVMWWDDGGESNAYVVGLGTTIGTHFKLTGSAQIAPGWTAGYVIHIEADGSDGLLGIDQDTPAGPGVYAGTTHYVQTLQSYWFIKSDNLGKVGIGLQSQASDNTAILPDGSGSLVPANFVQFEYGGFYVRDAASGDLTDMTWIDLTGCTDCNGLPLNVVRYDSPTFAGFSVSASWGEDDMWDVAARYAGEFGGIKVAAAAAYNETTVAGPGVDSTQFFQVGAYAEHIASGLWVYGAYGHFDLDENIAGFHATGNEFYYIKAGVRQRWSPLGHTVLYGEYERFDDGLFSAAFFPDGVSASSEVNLWGVGIVQEIDAAAMSIWLSYRHLDGSASIRWDANDVEHFNADDFQYVKFGALINF